MIDRSEHIIVNFFLNINDMKFTRKFLDGYITYDEDDAIVHTNSILGYIFKSIVALIHGTILGIIFTIILGFLAYIGFYAIVWLGSLLIL